VNGTQALDVGDGAGGGVGAGDEHAATASTTAAPTSADRAVRRRSRMPCLTIREDPATEGLPAVISIVSAGW
jgi:hypothetical protein